MEKVIVYGLILLMCLTGTFINTIGKLLLKKTCLQNGKTVRAQIVGFEEIIFLKILKVLQYSIIWKMGKRKIVLFVIMLMIIGFYPFLYRICYEYVGKQLGY
ncbi:MAG TPA: hypothetical protein DHV96_06545 [Lachnospiraceae bacterium]|nr:hypothetical protein [Lachnospiraceae bacterium]